MIFDAFRSLALMASQEQLIFTFEGQFASSGSVKSVDLLNKKQAGYNSPSLFYPLPSVNGGAATAVM